MLRYTYIAYLVKCTICDLVFVIGCRLIDADSILYIDIHAHVYIHTYTYISEIQRPLIGMDVKHVNSTHQLRIQKDKDT